MNPPALRSAQMYLRGPTVQCSPFGLRASCLSCLPLVSTESVLAAAAAAARGIDWGGTTVRSSNSNQGTGPVFRIRVEWNPRARTWPLPRRRRLSSPEKRVAPDLRSRGVLTRIASPAPGRKLENMTVAPVRRADFLMALSYATDLATGHSRDFALRSCVLAMRLADVAGLDETTRRTVYHQALLRYIGCNADTHLLAAAFGDEIALRRDLQRIDIGNKSELAETIVRAITRTFGDAPPAELAKAVERGLAEAMQVSVPILSGHCEVAQRIAERIGLSDEIRENLGQLYERWDGRGLPRGLSGNAVKLPVRLVTLAQDAIALTEAHGFATMTQMIAKRAGGAYEPELADLFVAHAERLLAGLDGPVDRETILALDPVPHSMLDEAACDEAYLAIADMIDMRMPFTF